MDEDKARPLDEATNAMAQRMADATEEEPHEYWLGKLQQTLRRAGLRKCVVHGSSVCVQLRASFWTVRSEPHQGGPLTVEEWTVESETLAGALAALGNEAARRLSEVQ